MRERAVQTVGIGVRVMITYAILSDILLSHVQGTLLSQANEVTGWTAALGPC